jgi:large subunit ribosomal protein LP0
MSGAESKAARKQQFFSKLIKLMDEYPKIFIVGADNVGSAQMQRIRVGIRGKGVLLMGKNTMIRKAIRGHIENNKSLEALLPHVRGNIGFVFCKDDLQSVKKVISELKVAAPAKVGVIAPSDVIVPAGPTGMEPTQTSFLQALNIPSKITRGQVEIINDVHLIKKGQKVGSSESTLLAKLDIKPFQYGLIIRTVYDAGSIYDSSVLDLTDEEIINKFTRGVRNIAAISLAIGFPTVASVPHSIIRGYKNVLAIALGTEYSFPKADKVKQVLANPSAFAAAPAPATSAPASGGGGAKKDTKPVKEEKKPEPEEDDADMGLGLFD